MILGYWVTYADGSTAFYGARSKGVAAWFGMAVALWDARSSSTIVEVRVLLGGETA